jgi:hypothetical protein
VVQLTEIQARRLSKETLRERLAEYALDEFPGDPVSEDDWRAWTREFAKKLRN